MAKTIVQPSVKFSLRHYHYRTHRPDGLISMGPYRSAIKAADAFAHHVALDFNYRYPKAYVGAKRQSKGIQIVMVSDTPDYQVRYQRAYRRSLKIFQGMGLK